MWPVRIINYSNIRSGRTANDYQDIMVFTFFNFDRSGVFYHLSMIEGASLILAEFHYDQK